jgi:type III secretion system chaperone
MSIVDIVGLLHSALVAYGSDPELLNGIDQHSTITLDFVDAPSIHISSAEHDIWVWSPLGDIHQNALNFHATEILSMLMQDCYFARGGQIRLTQGSDGLELQFIVHPDYLGDGAQFSEVINGFYKKIRHFREVLMQ